MLVYKIKDKDIELDEKRTYLDFYLNEEGQHLVQVNLVKLLGMFQAGDLPINDEVQEYMKHLQRWTKEAPRKRFYRDLRAKGAMVRSGEQFFDQEGGDEIINYLENSGRFADYFLKNVFEDYSEYEHDGTN